MTNWRGHALAENQDNMLLYKNIDIAEPALLILASKFLKISFYSDVYMKLVDD